MKNLFKTDIDRDQQARDAKKIDRDFNALSYYNYLLARRIFKRTKPDTKEIKRIYKSKVNDIRKTLDKYLIQEASKKMEELLLEEFKYFNKLYRAQEKKNSSDIKKYSEKINTVHLKLAKLSCLLDHKPDCDPSKTILYKILSDKLNIYKTFVDKCYVNDCNGQTAEKYMELVRKNENEMVQFIVSGIIYHNH